MTEFQASLAALAAVLQGDVSKTASTLFATYRPTSNSGVLFAVPIYAGAASVLSGGLASALATTAILEKRPSGSVAAALAGLQPLAAAPGKRSAEVDNEWTINAIRLGARADSLTGFFCMAQQAEQRQILRVGGPLSLRMAMLLKICERLITASPAQRTVLMTEFQRRYAGMCPS